MTRSPRLCHGSLYTTGMCYCSPESRGTRVGRSYIPRGVRLASGNRSTHSIFSPLRPAGTC